MNDLEYFYGEAREQCDRCGGLLATWDIPSGECEDCGHRPVYAAAGECECEDCYAKAQDA